MKMKVLNTKSELFRNAQIFLEQTILRLLTDEQYIKLYYRLVAKKKLNLDNPKCFDEKMQWMKLNIRDEKYTRLVDKCEARNYISAVLGEEFLIPLVGGPWNSVDEINFEELPDQFVLKCNHDSGGVIVVDNKDKLNVKKVKKQLKRKLKCNYYYSGREWPYKNIIPQIYAEKYMKDDVQGITDYKFMCFNGYVDCVMLCKDRHLGNTKFYYYDKDWKFLEYDKTTINNGNKNKIEKPLLMDEMFEVAERLSKGFPFVRIDLYIVENQIYFGEFTFFPSSGVDRDLLPKANERFGNLIQLN